MSEDPKPWDAGQAIERLNELVTRLRAPDGCPWDREQTPASVAPYLLEEAFEAAGAVESGSPSEARAELGDLLFQVVFMARLYEEAGHFGLAQVIKDVHDKMIRRHPHVFGDQEELEEAGEVRDLWDEIKKEERKQSGQGLLDSVPQGAPALVVAQRMGSRAARVGFDWQGADEVIEKIAEEFDELLAADNQQDREAELGDLLFTLAQWSRHAKLGSEAALRKANARFVFRFKRMEHMARERGLQMEDMSIQELDRLWEEAKAQIQAHGDREK